jgi:hypothetical protein
MFKQLLLGLVLVFGLSGCVASTGPGGASQPDYELIEIGSMAAMAVLVNEIKISDTNLLATYTRLSVLHTTLLCEGNCPPFNLDLLEGMITQSLPIEYKALGVAAIRLIKSRANMYLDVKLPDSENIRMIKKISASVVFGMVQAMEPKVLSIRG